MINLLVKLGFVFLFLGNTQAQDSNCDFYQDLVPGRTYPINNPNYPSSYNPGSTCRWTAVCPSGYNVRLDCPEINMPKSDRCSVDRLLVSKTGDPQLTSADYYCGQGTLTNVISSKDTTTMGLVSSTSSPGGRFSCRVTCVTASTPPSTCSCGYRRTNRIVGGDPTQPNEYTMMAGIIYTDFSELKCGAIILNTNYVGSAAHCFLKRTTANTAVIVGETDTTTESESPATQRFRIQSIVSHPQFKESNYDYDVAVVRVVGTIVFSEFVGPACLPFRYLTNSFAGAQVTILGYGTTYFGGPKSKVLRKATVEVISQSQCQNSVPVTPRQLCSYTPGKDACQDDSGGPMQWEQPSSGRLIWMGIISTGVSCASNSPGIYTRVTSVLNWIVDNAPGDYCRV